VTSLGDHSTAWSCRKVSCADRGRPTLHDKARCGYQSPMRQAQLALAPDTSAPSKAREVLLQVMEDQKDTERFHRALLALSEVVTNAVRYGVIEGSDPINLQIERTDDLVAVRVMQPRPVPERPSIADVPEGWSTRGYGLRIIDAVADRWGVQLDPPSVWFELRL
jgi:anti-sigma regulatory factor (Ser/Thr protein kinase)